jgi:hypothetical protein
MVQVLRLLRRLPVAQKVEDIAIFINRELLPFLQELRESTAATFEQVTTNTLLGRDTPGTGDVEEISLDDTLEFTGSQVIQRAAITGDVTIPAGSNVSTIPTLAGILSDITALESAEYVTYSANASLTNERVLTSGTNTVVDIATPAQAKINVDDFPLTGLADQAAETFNGNFTAGAAPPTARAGTSVAGGGLTYTAGGTLAVGAGTGITVSADAVSVTLPAIQTQSVTGTLNAHVLPTALAHGDTLIFSPTGATTLNGIDLQNALAVDWPEGFEFVLGNSSASFDVTIIDEAGTASALDRISTPVNQTFILGQSCHVIMRRAVTRWSVIERGWPTASTSITYSGASIQRAALTGFAAASANSNATTSAEPIVTYSSSGNMTAERVTTSSTSVTVSTSVANQIEFQRAALTGAITATANSNATLFDTNASGAGLTGGGTAVLAVGAGTGIAVNANDVAVDATWAEILVNGNNSGAFNPHIDSGQYIGFGVEGTLPIALATDIQHSSSMHMASGTDFNITAGLVNLGSGLDGNINLRAGVSTGSIELEAGSDVNSEIVLDAGGLISIGSISGISILGGPIILDATASSSDVTIESPAIFQDDSTFNGPVVLGDTVFKTAVYSATLAAGTNNLNVGAVSVVRFGLTGSQTLTGIVPTSDGQTLWVFNSDSADTLTLAHLSTSTASNQFLCPNNVNYTLPPRCGVALWYDSTSSLWFILAK